MDLKDETWDGFLLGQEIRRLDPHATLVYITSYGDLAYRTFQYHLEAFDYILKEPDRLERSVAQCLEAVQARLAAERRDPREIFTVRTGDAMRNIPLDDILFLKRLPRPTMSCSTLAAAGSISWEASTNWKRSWGALPAGPPRLSGGGG